MTEIFVRSVDTSTREPVAESARSGSPTAKDLPAGEWWHPLPAGPMPIGACRAPPVRSAADGGRPGHLARDRQPGEDTRFQALAGPEAWARLPAVVQQRFSRRLAPGDRRLFAGSVLATRVSRAGRLLARLTRLLGPALPDSDGATGPASVLVMESPALGGQIYSRTYARPGRLPQTINSVKRFAGPTGLEEAIGGGLVMRLTIHVEAGALVFRSAGYDLEIAGLRLGIPRWLSPGTCTITHRAEDAHRFTFTLSLEHPVLGRLVHQVARFEEV